MPTPENALIFLYFFHPLFVNKFICADALEFLSKLESESVDLALTDPPYFLDKMDNNWDPEKVSDKRNRVKIKIHSMNVKNSVVMIFALKRLYRAAAYPQNNNPTLTRKFPYGYMGMLYHKKKFVAPPPKPIMDPHNKNKY